MMDDVRAGVYRHYKNKLYLVLGLAHDANADTLTSRALLDQWDDGLSPGVGHDTSVSAPMLEERTVVVYIGLQLDDAHTGPRLAVRSYDDFFAYVDPKDGSPVPEDVVQASRGSLRYVKDRGYVQRFTYVGPTWEGQ